MISLLLSFLLTYLGALYAVASKTDCPELYLRYSAEHTFCKPPNAACSIIAKSVSEKEKQEIVKIHNQFRNKIAAGKEKISNMPQAANMLQLEWDDELAAVAQKHAELCEFEHECNRCRQTKNFEAGQNLGTMSSDEKLDSNWKEAITMWYEEVKDFDSKLIDAYDDPSDPNQVHDGTEEGQISHFTQLIWATTWKVGCGYAQYKEGDDMTELYTCNYGPAGNAPKLPIYIRGKSCSQCPQNTACSNNPVYGSLCKVQLSKHPVYFSPSKEYIYFCDFEEPEKCDVSSSNKAKPWKLTQTLSGANMGVILAGGESSSLIFKKTFPAKSESCLSLLFRKGPNKAGEQSKNEAKLILQFPKSTSENAFAKDSNSFVKFNYHLKSVQEFKMSITFSVPKNAPKQYLEVTNIFFKEGKC